ERTDRQSEDYGQLSAPAAGRNLNRKTQRSVQESGRHAVRLGIPEPEANARRRYEVHRPPRLRHLSCARRIPGELRRAKVPRRIRVREEPLLHSAQRLRSSGQLDLETADGSRAKPAIVGL